jgi:hypothetical protein
MLVSLINAFATPGNIIKIINIKGIANAIKLVGFITSSHVNLFDFQDQDP